MKPSEYFKDYPQAKQCFETSDGLIFHQEGDARLHAKTLENDAVKEHKNVKKEEKTKGTKINAAIGQIGQAVSVEPAAAQSIQ